jgi:hypothetical protein
MERSPTGSHEESDDCILPRKPRTKPSDIGDGDGGGKAIGRKKGTSLRMSRTQSRNWYVTEAARPRIGVAWAAQAPKSDHVRPLTGARCVSSAHQDLCGEEQDNPPPYRDSKKPCEKPEDVAHQQFRKPPRHQRVQTQVAPAYKSIKFGFANPSNPEKATSNTRLNRPRCQAAYRHPRRCQISKSYATPSGRAFKCSVAITIPPMPMPKK